jgi:hypothetical protein
VSSEKRFDDYKPKVTPSQCSDCQNNKSAVECLEYEVKPDKYAFNKEVCPEFNKDK